MHTHTETPAMCDDSESGLASKLNALGALVGNTPLLGIVYSYGGRRRTIYAKCEQLNLTGSIKDRMALHILKRAYAEGELHPGATIVEASSGNTGISFSALGRAMGHHVRIFMPDWMSQERKDLIRGYGAEVKLVSREQGGFIGSIQMTEELAAADENVFLPQQFSNQYNAEAHESTTGPEIWLQLAASGVRPDAFVAGVGTGGTVMGVGRFLRSQSSTIKIHPVEPEESPTLSTGHKIGKHRIQGISDEFIPAIVDLSFLDCIITASDGDSILMAQKITSCLGLAVGISSGCNFVAAVKAQELLGPDAVVTTVFPDDNKKYLSTDLMQKETLADSYLTPEIEFLGIKPLPRVCALCDARQ
jgi:cysteine synthase A